MHTFFVKRTIKRIKFDQELADQLYYTHTI